MSFLDENGLSYFYNKLKGVFIRSVTDGKGVLLPDSSGNVTITNVPTADNLTSPDGQTSYGCFIYRTSGGSTSLETGSAELMYIDGNVDIVGRISESFVPTVPAGLTLSYDLDTWRSVISSDGIYQFAYNKPAFSSTSVSQWTDNGVWSVGGSAVTLSSYGLSVGGVISPSIRVMPSGTGVLSAAVVPSTFVSQLSTTGNYSFIYNSTDSAWYYSDASVSLETYGLSINGTADNEDELNVSLQMGTNNTILSIAYTAPNQGTINIATPSAFVATGFNQFDKNSMVLSSVTIDSGEIKSGSNIICYCKAVGGVNNGYVAYSSAGHISKIGWTATVPSIGSEVTTQSASVTATRAAIPFDNDGYVVVEISNSADLDTMCIHPQWSDEYGSLYAAYKAPSTIAIPSKDVLNNNLPTATYGMPAVGAVADRINLETGTYIKKIDRMTTTASNLETVRGWGVAYDYDESYIYYVLDTPESYDIAINPNYEVDDYGTEEFIGTTVPVNAQMLYGQNLRDKLRTGVELKKILYTNVTVASSAFNNANPSYTDYPYTGTISLPAFSSRDIPNVVFGLEDATSGNFAPIASSGNGCVYVYATSKPEGSTVIPTIIGWKVEVDDVE